MPEHLPIACSLGPAEMPARVARMAALGRDALAGARIHGTRAELRFSAGAGVRERVDAIVEAESRCCAFLAMGVTTDADTVVLSIHAPEGAEIVLGELVDALAARRARLTPTAAALAVNPPRSRRREDAQSP